MHPWQTEMHVGEICLNLFAWLYHKDELTACRLQPESRGSLRPDLNMHLRHFNPVESGQERLGHRTFYASSVPGSADASGLLAPI